LKRREEATYDGEVADFEREIHHLVLHQPAAHTASQGWIFSPVVIPSGSEGSAVWAAKNKADSSLPLGMTSRWCRLLAMAVIPAKE
jgi:hypothetical protein